ncbi:MAG: FHA domain-containing protein [Verrucomicrobiales bacterium]|nr:FHA domain-containing protein [Verrucomicrobiales bacterium]
MPQLIFNVENGYPQIYNLLTRKTTVGRNADNDVALMDARVSEYHAELVRIEEGMYQLNDLDSDNGTAVNGKLIDETPLKDGDQIKFGAVNAAFVDQSESAEDKLLRETVEKDLSSKSEKLAKLEEAIEIRTNDLNAIPESKSELKQLERAIAELEHHHESEKNRLQAVQTELQNTQQRQTDLLASLESGEKELEELQKDRAELQHQYRRVHTANENSSRLKEELNAELEVLRKEIEEEQNALNDCRQSHIEARAVIEEAKAIRTRMNEFELGLQNLKNSYEELGTRIVARNEDQKILEQNIAAREETLRELDHTLETKHRVAEELSRIINENNSHINASREMLEKMELTLQKEIAEVSRSKETQESLHDESISLSHLISGKTAVLHRLKDKFEALKNGEEEKAEITCPPLRVINPAMRSLVQYFQHGAGIPDQDRVNPIGYYGLAACTRGSMHRDADTVPSGDDPVLVLLHGDMEKDKNLVAAITRDMPNRDVLVCWREGQLEALFAENAPDSRQINLLLGASSGIVSVDSRTAEIIDELKIGRPHLSVPLPCPVEIPEWNPESVTPIRPRGIFVSVSGFDPESKLHRSRLELLNRLVAETGTTVTLYFPEPGVLENLTIPADRITEIATPLKYSECLAFMREHSFVTGFGKNLDGGDILGDAMLSRTVFVGADFNRVNDQLLFPDSCIKADEIESALKNATRLHSDRGAYDETIQQAQNLASELISFESVSDRLGSFVHSLSVSAVAV